MDKTLTRLVVKTFGSDTSINKRKKKQQLGCGWSIVHYAKMEIRFLDEKHMILDYLLSGSKTERVRSY